MRRKQADQVRPQDRIGLNVQFFVEVTRATVRGERVDLEVIPARCLHPECPTGCDCQSAMLAGHGGPLFLSLDAKSRLPFAGNLAEDEAELRRLTERISQLRADESSTSQDSDQHRLDQP